MFQSVSNLELLTKSYYKAARRKRYRPFICNYEFNLEENLINLQHLLKLGTYKPLPYTHFLVFEPKTRQVSAPHFRDRILQHALHSQIEPMFDRIFIYDSYACRTKKGTHFALRRVQKFLKAAHSKHPKSQIYVLQCDINKYFQSINWDILLKIFAKKITCKQTFNLIENIITHHKSAFYRHRSNNLLRSKSTVTPKTRTGLPIGNLISQLCANIYLNELDKFVKHNLKAKWYGRYMDDFLIISPDKKFLIQAKTQIEIFLKNKLKLRLHPRKVSINNVSGGVPFVGYRIFKNHIVIRGDTLRRIQKNYTQKLKHFKEGKISSSQIASSKASFYGHLKQANTYFLQKHLFKELGP